MFGKTIRRPIIGGLGLAGLGVVVLAGALLVTGVGGGGTNNATSPAATIGPTGALSPASPATTISATATVGQASPFTPVATANPSGTFAPTGSMTTARVDHTATLLADGRVLIAGGNDSTKALVSAELYDPASGTFSPTGSMATARWGHTATRLSDGRVLIAGGIDPSRSRSLASAELYDPTTGTFSPTGPMATARSGHTATLLPDGRVLITGGEDDSKPPNPNLFESPEVFDSAELYYPATGTFGATGSMATARSGHTATLLSDGQVLIVGGHDGTEGPEGVLSSAELYDRATGKFISTGSMATSRSGHTATRVSDGLVLVVGGVLLDAGSGPVASAELYDPTTGTFSLTGSMTRAHINLTATLLSDGRVLLAGGVSVSDEGRFSGMVYAAELFDPATGTFRTAGSILNARERQTATLLDDGRVLLVGGDDGDQAFLASAELYTP